MTNTQTAAAYQGVLFDLDGTLLDTAPDFVTALNRVLAERELAPLAPELIRAGVTHGSAGLVTLAFGIEPHEEEFESLRQSLLGHYRECLAEETTLFPGMAAILTRLAEWGIPWGIVTNKPTLYTTAILEQLPLPCAPAAVICPEHVSRTKPDPESVLLACRQLPAEPDACLFVGDHRRDIEAGLRAGCHTVSALYGYIDDAEDPEGWGAHFVIDSPAQLEAIIFTTTRETVQP